ncbi:MAG: serine/threonine protein kinase [Acidimicrobiia bacterium]|nr:serine/threonine protein kinase [Acidimicrobiia bacterium]
MSAEAVLDLVIGNIADGAPVNWRQLEEESRSEEDRDWAGALRILSEVANLHRLMEDPLLAQLEASVTLPADVPRVLPDGTPNTWGRYRLNHKVGEGSFGRVYRAWDPQLERDVAIKILHGHVSDTRLKDRLLREGRALAKVRHPNVVTVLGVEAHEDRVGLCMEFVHGETLANHVQAKGALSAIEATVIGEDVCRALAAVHRAGFVHRDVKARNVMRDETGRIVLMDFGTGAEVNRAWALGGLVGTPAYMAPEVLDGDPASERSDVYGVGVLLYFLVSKAYPVVGQTIEDVRDAHVQRRRTPLIERRPDLPVSFLRVVERATAADPEERYASAPELLQALQEVMRTLKPVSFFTLPVRIATAVTTAAFLLVAVGGLTSAVFNLVFERADFANETATDWLGACPSNRL